MFIGGINVEYFVRMVGEVDLEELKSHLIYNGYNVTFSGNCLYIPDNEVDEVITILQDRNIQYSAY